jgi:hypothetical protein
MSQSVSQGKNLGRKLKRPLPHSNVLPAVLWRIAIFFLHERRSNSSQMFDFHAPIEFRYDSIENARNTTMGVSSFRVDPPRSSWPYIAMSAATVRLCAVKSEYGW